MSTSESEEGRSLPASFSHADLPKIKYREFLEGLGAGIFAIDMKGRFIYVNAEGLELLGYGKDEASELVGQHFMKILAPEHVPVAEELLHGNRFVRPPTMQVIRKDGSTMSVEVSGAWVRRRGLRVGALAMAWATGVAPAPEAAAARADLSKLDMTILQLICTGLSNREIAERVYLSTHTIKDRIEKIMRYFGVSRRAELAAKAARQGLV